MRRILRRSRVRVSVVEGPTEILWRQCPFSLFFFEQIPVSFVLVFLGRLSLESFDLLVFMERYSQSPSLGQFSPQASCPFPRNVQHLVCSLLLILCPQSSTLSHVCDWTGSIPKHYLN